VRTTTSAKLLSTALQTILSGISQAARLEPLKKIDYAIAYARARGESVKDICAMFRVEHGYVEALQKREDFAREVVYTQGALRMSTQDRIRAATNIALDVKLQQMMTAKPEIKERSASFFIEHDVGKPTQKVQSINMHFSSDSSVEDIDARINAVQKRIDQVEDERKLLKGEKITG
jgi:hypothetical protein